MNQLQKDIYILINIVDNEIILSDDELEARNRLIQYCDGDLSYESYARDDVE